MPREVKPIPDGYHSVTPYLTVNDAARAIDFYKRAFGAQETVRMQGPPGKIGHAELKIGDSIVMLADEMPGNNCRSPQSLGGSTVNLFVYVKDVDSAFKQAVNAGAKVDAQPTDMFWGDRCGTIVDPEGNSWMIATHMSDPTPQEMMKKMKELYAQAGSAASS